MKKDLNKVASALNEQILNGLFKKAADQDTKAEDKKTEQEKGDAFRKRRTANRNIEGLTPLARVIGAQVIGAALGAWAGAGISGQPVMGALAGLNAGTGLGLTNELVGGGIGTIIGGLKGGRSRKEQREYDSKNQAANWKQWVIPGYGAYQNTRRRMRMVDALEDLPEQNG